MYPGTECGGLVFAWHMRTRRILAEGFSLWGRSSHGGVAGNEMGIFGSWRWSSDRYEGGLNLFYAPETDFGPRWTQTPEKDLLRHILTCFYHFWALFCLKPTRNALFTPFLVQNGQVAVTKQVQIGFSRPGPFWAPEWPQTPKMGFLNIKYT